jgi:hypothetical protein
MNDHIRLESSKRSGDAYLLRRQADLQLAANVQVDGEKTKRFSTSQSGTETSEFLLNTYLSSIKGNMILIYK